MSNVITKELGKICERLSSGKNIVAKDIKEFGEFPVYGANGLRGFTDSYNFDGECAIIGRQGAYVGNVRYFTGKAYMSEHAVVAQPKDTTNCRFLAYYLSLINLGRLSGQSAQPGLSVQTLSKEKINLPPLEIQNKIAKTLDVIDKKIENNDSINDNLSRMSYEIYMHTFFKKKPSGKLGSILIENEKSNVQVGDAKNSNGVYPFFTSGEAILCWNDFIVEERNCFLNTGGNADVKFYVGKAAYSTDTWCITAKDNLSDYLYLLLKSIKPELDKKFFQGTGLKHLQKPLLRDRAIYIPTSDEIMSFNKQVQPMFNVISENTRENQCLRSLRDWLLPMLMNGQAIIND